MNNLISTNRVKLDFVDKIINFEGKYKFELVGFVQVENVNKEYFSFEHMSDTYVIDGKETEAIPVYFNYSKIDWLIWPTEADNPEKADLNKYAIAFFHGNDDISIAVRFNSFEERDLFIRTKDCNSIPKEDLIYYN